MLNRSLYLFLSKVVGFAIRLVLPVFLVRVLTKADVGAYNQFFLIEVAVVALFQLGVNQSLYYFIPRDKDNAGSYFLTSLCLNLLLFGLAFAIIRAFLAPIATWMNWPVLMEHFWLVTTYTGMMMLMISADCYITSLQLVRQSAFFTMGGQLLVSLASLGAAVVHRELQPVLTALVIARAAHLAAMMIYIAFRIGGFRARRYFFNILPQVRYGVILGLGGTVWTFLMQMHNFVVSKHFGQEGFAIYAIGCKQIPVLAFYTQSLAVVSLSQFALLEKERDWAGIRRLWDKVLTSSVALALPMTVILLLVSKPLILLMFTAEYADSIPIFRINTLVMLHLVLNPKLVLRAMDRNGVSLVVQLGCLILALPAMLLGMELAGMVGIIAAHCAVMNASRLISYLWLNRITEYRLPLVPSARDLWCFYRDTFFKGRAWLARRLPGPSAG